MCCCPSGGYAARQTGRLAAHDLGRRRLPLQARALHREHARNLQNEHFGGHAAVHQPRARHFHVRPGCRVLYSLAPMPYATGMFPDLISSEIHLRFMPSVREARADVFRPADAHGLQAGGQIRHEPGFSACPAYCYGATPQPQHARRGKELQPQIAAWHEPAHAVPHSGGQIPQPPRRHRPQAARSVQARRLCLRRYRHRPVQKTNWRKPGASARWRSRAAPSLPAWAPRPGAKTALSFSGRLLL